MAKDDFYIVNSWMIDELDLSGVELQCFAIIWSLSRGEKQMYIGGNSHLIKMTKKTEPTIITALKKLCSKGYIKKIPVVVNNVDRNYYKAISYGVKEILVGGLKNFSGGTKKNLAPNIESNIESNNKEKRLSNDNQKKDEFSQDFLEFWELYDNKKNKVGTYKKWKNLSAADKKEAIAAIPAYFADCKAHNNREKKHPLTYLNQRTWEDDFTSEYDKEEKEETQVDEIPAGDIEAWNNNQKWMQSKTPRIASKVTYQMFAKMRALATWNNKLYAEVLVEIDRSGYDGDIVAEFNRLIDKHSKV